MKKILNLALGLVLAAGIALAQKPTEKVVKKEAPKFEPAEVVAAAAADYPVMSIAEGTVVLRVAVNAEGEAEEVKVLRGIPSLTEEALRSIKKWKFTAAKLDGKAVPGSVVVAFVFTRSVIP